MKFHKRLRLSLAQLTLAAVAYASLVAGLHQLTLPLRAAAQETTDPTLNPPALEITGTPMAGIVGSQAIVYDELGHYIANRVRVDIQTMVWNDNGSILAISGRTSPGGTLLFSATTGGVLLLLPTDLLEPFPPTFTPEGDILVATQRENQDFSQGYVSGIQRITPQDGAVPVDVGSFTWTVGCGGGSPYPSDALYWGETGFGGAPLTFTMTPYGLLHSTTCSASGLALFDLQTGIDQAIPNTERIGSVNSLSADKTYLIASQTDPTDPQANGGLVRLDLASFAITPIPTSGRPDQVALGADGVIYYSTSEIDANLLDNVPEVQRGQVVSAFGMLPDDPNATVPHQTSSLYRLDPTTGEEQVLLDHIDAYAIARITPLATGDLIYSLIPNMDAYVQGLADGTFMPQDSAEIASLMPVQVVISSATGGDSPRDVVRGLARFTVPPYVLTGL